MDIEEIKTLTDLMVENDLSEIMIRDGDKRILLRRRGSPAESAACLPPGLYAAAPAPAAPAAAALPAPASAGTAPAAPTSADDRLTCVKSPMVGTYYAASDPESPPFVKVGDRIEPDTVVCIIEAMKVFNEIKAEASGILESIEVENAAPVEFGQVLMKLRPA
ncbi:MAG: acetyl-CoA carboxylase biotin carboxyl carrier protein [Phycisphaerae bacterium]